MGILTLATLKTTYEVLKSIYDMGTQMQEGGELVLRLYGRLSDLLGDMENQEVRDLMDKSRCMEDFASLAKQVESFVQKHRSMNLIYRLCKHQETKESIRRFHEDIDHLFQRVHLRHDANMSSRQHNWEKQFYLNWEDAIKRLIDPTTLLRLRKVSHGVNVMPTKEWFLHEADIEIDDKPIGCGAFGEVLLGVHDHHTRVVVKRLIRADERMRQDFRVEIENWWKIKHLQFVLNVFGACDISDPPFIVCEYAPHGSLDRFLLANPGNERHMWRLLYEAAQGLNFLHKNNVIHGDIKCNNIHVGEDLHARLADFGTSVRLTSSRNMSATKQTGANRWTAPECLEGKNNATEASDWYAFGMCILEAASGQVPWTEVLADVQVFANVKNGTLPARPSNVSEVRDNAIAAGLIPVALAMSANESVRVTSMKALDELYEASPDVVDKIIVAGGLSATLGAPSLVAFLNKGTQSQKNGVLWSLIWLGGSQPDVFTKIADADGIPPRAAGGIVPLVKLATNGTELQKEYAACALGYVATGIEENQVEIADAGGIVPLVRLAATGTDKQKEHAAYALGHVGFDNKKNQVAIAGAGGIPPLVQMVASGTGRQKDSAAFALSMIVSNVDANGAKLVAAGGIAPLVQMISIGSDDLADCVARALYDLASNKRIAQSLVDAAAERERKRQVLQRIAAAHRPNSSYLGKPVVIELLQHVVDALTELLVVRSPTPFVWLADFLRYACKVTFSTPREPTELLMLEMHKKRRIAQHAIHDREADEFECKRLLREIIALEQELSLPLGELRMTRDDYVFLATEVPSEKEQWSVDDQNLPAFSEFTEQEPGESQSLFEASLPPTNNLELYYQLILDGAIKVIIELQLIAPTDPVEWLISRFRHETASAWSASRSSSEPSAMLLKTNFELMKLVESLQEAHAEMHERLDDVVIRHRRLNDEVTMRQRFIMKLSTSNLTTRTQAIMEGTPLVLNSQKHWVLPGYLLLPATLTPDELLGLRRAERYLMQKDETRWRFLILAQKRFDASVRIQACWRCHRDYESYQQRCKQRTAAARIIQRNYLRCLVAQRFAIRFAFYAHKDFPTGNYRRVGRDSNGELRSLEEMMELCRQDDECAAFSVPDGALKRFVPRKLSQYRPMADDAAQQQVVSTSVPGIYLKVYPAKNEAIVNTGIIVAVPDDRFGLVQVVLDGLGLLVDLPVAKVSNRWKRIRVKRTIQRERKVRKTYVFGKMKETLEDADAVTADGFELCPEDDEEEERRLKIERIRSLSTDSTYHYVFEDQATMKIVDYEPRHTHATLDEREGVIADRKKRYIQEQVVKETAKRLESAIRLQCAWRSRRARAAFHRVLLLRAKEKDRAHLVRQVNEKTKKKTKNSKPKDPKERGFFSKWIHK
ncbi:TPA: hypothetical protein N0F65_003329 [Lagenidium giganteum]|uniref:Protein kinase domain-containing protein n=1 Tax=Lagenidium giganteum TaxID=4803 RepID=A0AAV2Z8L9_9STRA|nr:TPA: hypothetical protein N0F65_003329 [Lagenidium giganteum]